VTPFYILYFVYKGIPNFLSYFNSAIQHQEKNWYAYLIKNLTGARKASESLFLKVCIYWCHPRERHVITLFSCVYESENK